MASQTQPLTLEDLLELPERDDDLREEVIDGYLVAMPPPTPPHEEVVDRLRDLLKTVFPRPRYRFSAAGLLISRSPLTVRIPDIAVFPAEAVEGQITCIQTPPLLAVEVLSPSNTRRKTQRKLRDYASVGVPEVWLVSPEGETVEVLLLEGGTYRTATITASGDLSPAAQPEARVPVRAMFADA